MINNFKEIPQLTRSAPYMVNVGWDYLFAEDGWMATQLQARDGMSALNMDPDFQRGHVWTEAQQIAYVEYRLRGGEMSGRHIFFNHPGWMGKFTGDYVIVDGLQRLTAARRFMENEIPAFGTLFNNYEDGIRRIGVDFIICVNTLKTRAEVLRWYLEMNAGGTPHSVEEIQRVTKLYEKEAKSWNLHLYATEALRLVGALSAGLAILAVVWFITPKQDKKWCDIHGMECFERLAVRR